MFSFVCWSDVECLYDRRFANAQRLADLEAVTGEPAFLSIFRQRGLADVGDSSPLSEGCSFGPCAGIHFYVHVTKHNRIKVT